MHPPGTLVRRPLAISEAAQGWKTPPSISAYVNLAQALQGAGEGGKLWRRSGQALSQHRQPELRAFVADLKRVRARLHLEARRTG